MVETLYLAALTLISVIVILLIVKNRIRQSAELNRHLVHDVKHHLLILREYVKEDNLEGIGMYLDEIEDEYMYVPRKVWTGNGFLDFILNQKKSKAEKIIST